MGGAFNAEQIAQMATGALNQQQQQSATQGPQDTPIDQATLDQQSMQQYLDGLSESEAARYEQLINSGYKLNDKGAIGRVDGILVREDKILEGGADKRGDDTAIGF